MRPTGQPPVDRIVRVFLLSPCHRGGGAMTASARQPSRSFDQECRVCQSQLPIRNLTITNPQPLRWPAARSCSEEQEWGGGRNARATSRARARFWMFPRRIRFRNHRLPLALPQSSGRVRNPHVSLESLSVRMSYPAIQKAATTVQKLWTKRLPCGRHRKSKKEFKRHANCLVTYTLLKDSRSVMPAFCLRVILPLHGSFSRIPHSI